MAIFQPIKLAWEGREFTIPADRVMGAIAEIEEVVTLPELFEMGGSGRTKISKLSRAYGVLLRYAGAAIDDEAVYQGMFAAGETHKKVTQAVHLIVTIMMPPSVAAGASSEGNVARAKGARSRLSSSGTRRPSAAAG